MDSVGGTVRFLRSAPIQQRHSVPPEPPAPKLPRALPAPGTVRASWLKQHPCPPGLNLSGMQYLLDHDNHEMRNELRAFLADPLFRPVYDVSLQEERDLALRRLQALCKQPGRFISVKDFLTNPHRVFAAHELIGLADGSLATKLTVQFNLAGGTLLKLGTERHHGPLLDGIDRLEDIGCFALTELSYGNNAVRMETTAVYDATKKEFIINTGNPGAQKYWITNSAIHAQFAVVFAQLYFDNVHRGIHAFIVPIRDKKTHLPLPGVWIEDMGHKIGCNGVDNGRLAFNNVRVPRTALLNKYSDVTEDGNFNTSVKGKRQLFIKVADQLLSGRLCISSMGMGVCKLALTIAVRYAISRLAVGKSGESDTPLLAYQIQQRALAPMVARTYASAIALDYCKDKYAELQNCGDDNVWREVVVLCCAIKPMVAWTMENIVSVTRERCGGAGYLSANRFGHMLGFSHAAISAEGDCIVLMQKAAKELLVLVAQGRVRLARTGTPPPLSGEVDSDAYLRWALEQRVAVLTTELGRKMHAAEAQGQVYEVWMEQESELVQQTAMAYIELVAYSRMVAAVDLRGGRENRGALQVLRQLYALDCVQRNLAWYLSSGVMAAASQATAVERALRKCIASVGPVLPWYCSAFGIPDHLIHAPIAMDFVSSNAVPGMARL